MQVISRIPCAGLLAVLIVFIPAVPKTFSADWYVDSAATSGTRSGDSWENAWTSMASISWSSLSPGDIVFVRGGPYLERVAVARGGASATQRITLKGIGQPSVWGINGGSADYVAVLGFEFTQGSSANNYAAIRLSGADGWLIEDNYFHDTYGGGVDGAYGTVNSFNVIRNNRFDDICSIDGGAGNAAVISMYGDSNLIEYNSIVRSLDRIRAFGSGNVVRNNYFGPTDTPPYPNTSPYPFHTDGFQSYNSSRVLQKLLFASNWDVDNRDSVGGSNAHGFLLQDSDGSGLNWAIIRFNVTIRPGGIQFQFKSFDRAYVYNNTGVSIQSQSSSKWQSAITYDSPGGGDLHDYRNNTWCYSPNLLNTNGIITTTNRPSNFTADYQHSFNDGSNGTLPAAEHNLAHVDPRFSDVSVDDYTLLADSPLVGAGGPITFASSSGANSAALLVVDARRLFDGWGIADADWIRIGPGGFVQISSIDYDANTVYLSSAQTWSANDPIYVKGNEDIGALPYDYAKTMSVTDTSPDLQPGTNTLTAAVADSDAVRMVEFLVDGIPVGIDYSPPYSAIFVSDGKSHAVVVRAYAAWASPNPVVEAVKASLGYPNAPDGLQATPPAPNG